MCDGFVLASLHAAVTQFIETPGEVKDQGVKWGAV